MGKKELLYTIVSLSATVITLSVFQWITNKKECPKCSKKCSTTGVAGTKYKQHYCSNCQSTFWTDIYNEYEK
jgi:hypothetical protein